MSPSLQGLKPRGGAYRGGRRRQRGLVRGREGVIVGGWGQRGWEVTVMPL
jgi:hypothetical protein